MGKFKSKRQINSDIFSINNTYISHTQNAKNRYIIIQIARHRVIFT